MNDPDFNNTIEAAPTQSVTISDIGESSNDENLSFINYLKKYINNRIDTKKNLLK